MKKLLIIITISFCSLFGMDNGNNNNNNAGGQRLILPYEDYVILLQNNTGKAVTFYAYKEFLSNRWGLINTKNVNPEFVFEVGASPYKDGTANIIISLDKYDPNVDVSKSSTWQTEQKKLTYNNHIAELLYAPLINNRGVKFFFAEEKEVHDAEQKTAYNPHPAGYQYFHFSMEPDGSITTEMKSSIRIPTASPETESDDSNNNNSLIDTTKLLAQLDLTSK